MVKRYIIGTKITLARSVRTLASGFKTTVPLKAAVSSTFVKNSRGLHKLADYANWKCNVWTRNGNFMDELDSRLSTFEMQPLFKHDSSHLPSSETPEYPLFLTLWANYFVARDLHYKVSMDSPNKTYGVELYSLHFVSKCLFFS
ncbi:hypothetical protein M9H77_27322 [Catharanthus roseus]|uniref:Uncharacterized protein n=1 Tax=Catharanthus roseus TaxID=4058 RepID=A0ACC0AEC0_CATRO|nr:hypothetical protein M9H77_27322 [Catharanthus roseus]